MYYQTNYIFPLGLVTLVSDGKNLVGLWLENQKYFCSTVKEEMISKDELPIFTMAKEWLDRYFAGEKPSPTELYLAPKGGNFRQDVWKALCEIPYGETVTYGSIAKKLNAGCAQAVGGAVGHNPISIIIPCHRVVGANGSLTGYAAGIDKKIWLLNHEGADVEQFWISTKRKELG